MALTALLALAARAILAAQAAFATAGIVASQRTEPSALARAVVEDAAPVDALAQALAIARAAFDEAVDSWGAGTC